MNIYVGNLSRETEEDALRKAFEGFGKVDTCSIVKDKFSGDSRGFGFVEMPDKAEGAAAIEGLNEHELDGRPLVVNEARPKTDRPRMSSGPRHGGSRPRSSGGPRSGGGPRGGGRGGGRGGSGRDRRGGGDRGKRW